VYFPCEDDLAFPCLGITKQVVLQLQNVTKWGPNENSRL
jgi:hypothetical protein